MRTRPLVVFLDHCALLSGAELALTRLLPDLDAHVDAVVVLGEEGPLAERLRSQGVRVDVLPMADQLRERRKDAAARLDDLFRTAAYAWRLRSLLRRLQADLVHTNSLKAAVYGGVAGRLAGVPVVWHVRDRIAPDYLPGVAVRAVRTLACVLPSRIVANSEATRRTLPRSVDIAIVPDSVITVAPPDRLPRQDVLTFGVVGRLAPWKGQHVFLEAFAQAFRGSGHRAHLVGSAMFGEQDYASSLVDLAASLGIDDQVDFRGFHEDVDSEYRALDVLVHCSTIPEPFGQVVIEGQAHGLCVVAADAGGPAEIVSHEVDGLLVAPDDAPALAAALRRIAADAALRGRLAVAGRQNAARYSGSATALRILDVYDDLLRTPRRLRVLRRAARLAARH